MTLEINSNNLDELVASDKLLVIDFWTCWCGPCKVIKPIVEELSAEYAEKANIGTCDVEENDAIAIKYAIRNVPSILFIKGNNILERHVGSITKSALQEKIEGYL